MVVSLAKPELWNVTVDINVTAELSARSSVYWLQSLSVHLDPQSLLDLTTLVAAFLS